MTDNNKEQQGLEPQDMTRKTKRAATDKPKRTATPAQAAAGRQNLLKFNASRSGKPHLVHGVKSVIASGGAEIPPIPGGEEAARRVDSLIAGYIADLGGESEITTGRRTILAALRLSLLVLELSSRYLAEHGLLDANGRPHPLCHIANSYGNSARLHAVALGLERRTKDAMTLDAVLADIAERRKGKENHAESR
jgi:hypothetical protein